MILNMLCEVQSISRRIVHYLLSICYFDIYVLVKARSVARVLKRGISMCSCVVLVKTSLLVLALNCDLMGFNEAIMRNVSVCQIEVHS